MQTDSASASSQGFGGDNDVLCALRVAEARGEFSGNFHTATTTPPPPPRKQPALSSFHTRSKTTERTMGHIGPANGYFTNNQRHDEQHSPKNEYDALADLFLSHDDARNLLHKQSVAPQAQAAQPPFTSSEGGPALRLQPTDPIPLAASTDAPTTRVARIERVIVGHLPVLAGAWVTQYAKHVAATENCNVALVRMTDGVASIEVIRPAATSRLISAAADLNSLEGCIKNISNDIGVWLLRIDGVSDAAWAASSNINTVTLLTGADDAALVSSYRTLKSLASATASRPALRVAILGSENAKSRVAEDKLRRGTATFLGLSLDHVARIEKISPGSSTHVYESATNAHKPEELVTTLCRTLDSSSRDGDHTQDHSDQIATTSIKSKAASASTTNLAQDIPGLQRVAVTCPYAPSIEFAIEVKPSATQFHLLSADPVAGPAQLLVAANWLKSYEALLRIIAPSTPSMSCDPTLHIFTEDLRTSRGLLDTPIRVHFVIEVECQGETKRIVKQAN